MLFLILVFKFPNVVNVKAGFFCYSISCLYIFWQPDKKSMEIKTPKTALCFSAQYMYLLHFLLFSR